MSKSMIKRMNAAFRKAMAAEELILESDDPYGEGQQLPMELTDEELAPLMRAVLAAIESAGYVIVPREPTEAMSEAGFKARGGGCHYDDVYEAMISAAKETP